MLLICSQIFPFRSSGFMRRYPSPSMSEHSGAATHTPFSVATILSEGIILPVWTSRTPSSLFMNSFIFSKPRDGALFSRRSAISLTDWVRRSLSLNAFTALFSFLALYLSSFITRSRTAGKTLRIVSSIVFSFSLEIKPPFEMLSRTFVMSIISDLMERRDMRHSEMFSSDGTRPIFSIIASASPQGMEKDSDI